MRVVKDRRSSNTGVISEKYSPPNLLRNKTGILGFYSKVNLAHTTFTAKAKPGKNYSLPV